MYLYIDTSADEAHVALAIDTKRVLTRTVVAAKQKQSGKLLAAIDDLLDKSGKPAEKLSGIVVVEGPGGFSSLRIGITTANTFAFVLSIPVRGVPKGKVDINKDLFAVCTLLLAKAAPKGLVIPTYGAEPHITLPKTQ